MKNNDFVSVICVLTDKNTDQECYKKLNNLQIYLESKYDDYEIVLIGQKSIQYKHSKDITELLLNTPCIRYIQLSKNVTEDVAWAAGVENAIGDFSICYEFEFTPFDVINDSVELCKKGNDVVVGVTKENCSTLYRLIRPLSGWLLKLIDYNLPKGATSFRCLSRRAVNCILETSNYQQQFFLRVQKTGYEFKTLNYISQQKTDKKTFLSAVKLVLRMSVFNSLLPLRIVSLTGFFASCFAFVFAIYSIITKLLFSETVDGWTSTVFILSCFSMLQFIILSFIAEYLARLFDEQGTNSDYSIVYEKNSSVMIDIDRINVYESSINSNPNKTQTGRDR